VVGSMTYGDPFVIEDVNRRPIVLVYCKENNNSGYLKVYPKIDWIRSIVKDNMCLPEYP
jgi:hypothetical protein